MLLTQSTNFFRYSLYLKLFIVMGINSSVDVISYGTVQLMDFRLPFFFKIIKLINALHGFFIFLIFVCKRKTMRLLLRRRRLGFNNQDFSRNANSKSSNLPNSSKSGYNTDQDEVHLTTVNFTEKSRANFIESTGKK